MLSGVLQLFTDEKLPAIVAGLLSVGGLTIAAIYFVGFWAFEGQTPGMRFLGIRLEHDGDPGARGQAGGQAPRRDRAGGAPLRPRLRTGRCSATTAAASTTASPSTDMIKRENRILAPWSQNRVPGDPG